MRDFPESDLTERGTILIIKKMNQGGERQCGRSIHQEYSRV